MDYHVGIGYKFRNLEYLSASENLKPGDTICIHKLVPMMSLHEFKYGRKKRDTGRITTTKSTGSFVSNGASAYYDNIVDAINSDG